MEQEIWKPVPGYEGRYEVSSLGRLRSITVTYVNAANRLCTYPGRVLEGSVNPDGYRVFSLNVYASKRTCKGHTLVCEAFNGPRPSPEHEVNHKNFDRLDNRASNLEWLPHVENVRLSVEAGRMKAINGKKASNILLTPELALEIRRLLELGEVSRSSIAARFGCSRHTVNEIARGTQWVVGAPAIDGRPRRGNPWLHPKRRRKLTAEQVLAMRSERSAGVPVRTLAERYGVAVSTANDIVRGRSWVVTG